MSSDLMTLVIARSSQLACDIWLFDLRRADGGELPGFLPGAHILLRTPTGAMRRYSLANAPVERDRYIIAVKRDASGTGASASLISETNAGDPIDVSAPRNDFELKGNPASYLFIAGGIGITPIRSMIHHLKSIGGKPFKLVYLSRSPEMTAFRDEFTAPEYRGIATVHHDMGNADDSFDLWPLLEKPKGAHLYCCGPRGLLEAVRDMTGHWSSSAVHFEDFGVGKAARAADDRPFAVRLARRGTVIEIPAGKALIEVLREHGYDIASSCESGTCGTCRVRLLAGEPDHRDLVLTDDERLREIIVCVSRSHSPELTLDL